MKRLRYLNGKGLGLYSYDQLKGENVVTLIGGVIGGIFFSSFGIAVLFARHWRQTQEREAFGSADPHWITLLVGIGFCLSSILFFHVPVIYLIRRITGTPDEEDDPET